MPTRSATASCTNGTYTTIDHPLASSDTQAHDVNDRGQIAGLYERGAGQTVEAGDAADTAPNRVGDIGSARSPFALLWTGVDGSSEDGPSG